jgi:indolepyruvate ferredoxin oxidoreductase alpha subunit
VPVPAVARKLHARLLDNLSTAEALSCDSSFNWTSGQGPWGIICNGISLNYVQDAVKDLHVEEKVRILRLGFSHPFPARLIQEFLKDCEKVLVVEEGEPFMEERLKALAHEGALTLPIKGKGNGLFSRLSEFDPALVRQVIAAYFKIPCTPPVKLSLKDLPPLPARPPNLCAGCSHRATFYAVKKAAHGQETVCPTDIGCYSLGFLPPLAMGDFMICMGASVSSACGFAKSLDRKVIAFIGDSTFFHSGMTGLVNAVYNNHDLTLVILDNGTTAMTGHQPHPGTDMKLIGLESYNRISIEAVVKAIGIRHVAVIKPYKVKKSIAAIKQAIAHPGVSVVISEEMCTLYAKGLKKIKKRAFRVSDKCKNHRTCINDFACPAFYLDEAGGVRIDPDVCVGCTVCAQICPENAIVPIQSET